MAHRRWIAVLAVWAVSPGAAAQIIDTIVVESRGVAGEGRTALARLAASLHVATRPAVIRSALLLAPGDTLDADRIDESARVLRGWGLFQSVEIDTVRVAGRLALRVVTTDGWVKRPVFGFSTVNGAEVWEVGLMDQNLFGTAAMGIAHFRSYDGRPAASLTFSSPRFMARKLAVSASYANLVAWRSAAFSLAVPFAETVAGGSFAVDAEQWRSNAAGGSQTRGGRLGAAAGVTLDVRGRRYVRLTATTQWRRRADWLAGDAPHYATTLTPGATLDVGWSRYVPTRNWNVFQRREDVDLSQRLRVGLWGAPRPFGYSADRAGMGFEVGGQLAGSWQGGHLMGRGRASAALTRTGVDSGTTRGSVTLRQRAGTRHTTVIHGEVATMFGPRPPAAFDLFYEQRGPRLHGEGSLTGQGVAWLAAEQRLLVSESWAGWLGLALVAFADYGVAAGGGTPARRGGDFGLALRTGLTRSGNGEVTELAVGRRFGPPGTPSGWSVAVRRALTF
jgi:hypothetical protein